MMETHRVLITEDDHTRLLSHFRDSGHERMAFLYCGRAEAGQRMDWLVHTIDLAGDDEYRLQNPARVTLAAENVVGRIFRARRAAGFVDAHSHPFTSHPYPSSIDEEGADVLVRLLGDLAPDTRLLRLIVGRGGTVYWDLHDSDTGRWAPVSEVVVLGRARRWAIRPVNAIAGPLPMLDPLDTRTIEVMGSAAAGLRSTRALVIGAGGVGSAVATQLSGLVDRVDVVDPDMVEAHNLPRLYHVGEADIGRPKAKALAAALRSRFDRTEVEPHVGRFPDARSEELFRAADIVFCCPDHHAPRWAAASLAARFMKPLIEVGCGGVRGEDGAIATLGYHVRLQVPGGPCLVCNGLDVAGLEDPTASELKIAAGYIDGDDTVQGELVTLTSRAATDAVDVFLRYWTGYAGDAPGHIYFDALRFLCLNLSAHYHPDSNCSLCGGDTDGMRGAGDVLSEAQRIMPQPEEVAHVIA